MAQPTIKTSFASGEWAPKLRSRVDIQKYHSGAALLRNFYVDYSGGGASTRQGTKFINQAKATGARLIPFQPSTTVSYVLEFGNYYIRFYTNGAPVLETAVTGGSACSGHTFTIANSFNVGDWVYALNWGGMTNVNGNYYIVASGTSGSAVVVTDLNGNTVTFTGTYTSGGQLQRVYTLTSPYAASDLFPNPSTNNPGIKWVQDVTSMIICHPSYAPQILTITAAANWAIMAINFGASITTPTGLTIASTDSSGTTWYYGYLVTAVDINSQESSTPTPVAKALTNYIGDSTHQIANTFTWNAVSGAVSYNVYKASPSYKSTIATGAQYGFVGNVTGTTFIDSYPGIAPDFAQCPPVSENPFQGAQVASVTVTTTGSYTTAIPTATLGAPAAGGTQATVLAGVGMTGLTFDATSGGSGWAIGQIYPILNDLSMQPYLGIGVLVQVSAVSGGNATALTIYAPGNITTGTIPYNVILQFGPNPNGYYVTISASTWGVKNVAVVNAGSGYTSAPTVTFSAGSAAATAVLGTASGGNPGVPGFLQDRLWLANQPSAVQTVNISQPESFFNFNTSNPSEADDAISATIIGTELNDIRNLLGVPTGMIAFTGKGAYLLNGGGGISTMNPITPSNITAQPQAFNGANDLRPIKINMDVLYGTNKGNYVRDLSYNLYAQIFTGSDISVLANHLFFGYYLLDWAWAEEPFKTLWAIRNDGQLLSLGYVKEQEMIGWAHHDTSGQFTSVCSVIETVQGGEVVDAVYVIVQRVINGNTVQYVERMADRFFPYGYEDSWSVDCALQTVPQVSPTGTLSISGNASAVGNSVTLTDTGDAPFTSTMASNNWVVRAGGGIYEITAYTSTSVVTATIVQVPSLLNPYTNLAYAVTGGYTIWQPVSTVTGLVQLIGQQITGVADGSVVPLTTVSATGSITLSASASKVTLGLPFTPQLQTLPLDLGEPTIQGKRKKITALTLRVADTLGLQAGTTFANSVSMKDFQLGNVPTTSSGVASVTNLVSGDGRTIIDQDWQEAGNYCVQQNLPYPATILGVFPEVTVGDTK